MSELIQKTKQLTFEEICPGWSVFLNKYRETGRSHFTRFDGKKLNIVFGDSCVVGEAYGLKSGYSKDCDICGDFSYGIVNQGFIFVDGVSKSEMDCKIARFVTHWNEKHV